MNDAIGLIDCNNFYCSAERVFDARLKKKPVAVLSNNDGCIISRSQEVKDMGVRMGAPFFQARDVLEKEDAAVFSSNYELYGDMSARVMETLHGYTPALEVYSIDEAFLGLNESKKSFDYLGRDIKDKIYKHTGIPVGVGIASNKTLAKIANRLAKKSQKARGVVDLYKSPHIETALERTPIGDVWGIGRASTEKFLKFKIDNALQFKYANLRWVKKNFTVVGGRTLLELNGIRCLPLTLTAPPKKSITCSRSFGEPVTDAAQLFKAISVFLQTAIGKLREHKLACRTLTVFAHTNKFADNYEANSYTYKSAYPADNLFELQHWLGNCFDRIFKKGLTYKKAGIYLENLIPREGITERMFREERLAPRLEKLNRAMDEINRKFGKNTIRLAAASGGAWEMKRERQSPCYTTRFSDILKVR